MYIKGLQRATTLYGHWKQPRNLSSKKSTTLKPMATGSNLATEATETSRVAQAQGEARGGTTRVPHRRALSTAI